MGIGTDNGGKVHSQRALYRVVRKREHAMFGLCSQFPLQAKPHTAALTNNYDILLALKWLCIVCVVAF